MRHIKLPRAVSCHGQASRVSSMIGVAKCDDVEIACANSRHEQSEIVGLRPRIDEIADLQIARHPRGQSSRVFGDVGMQINRGGMLEGFVLAPDGLDDVRMAMPDADRYDSAQSIEIALAGVVPDILHPPRDKHERLLVVEKDSGIREIASEARELPQPTDPRRLRAEKEMEAGAFVPSTRKCRKNFAVRRA